MIRKIAAVIAFGVGSYLGYQYALDMIDVYSTNFEGYWGESGAQVIRVVAPLAIGAISAIVVYFLLNLFARAD